MPSLRSGKDTFAKAVPKRRIAPTASSRSPPDRECDTEMVEAIDKPNNIDEAASDETGTCLTGLNTKSEIAQTVQAAGEDGTDKSLVDDQEASEITNHSSEPVDIGDKSNSSEADPGALDLGEANKHAASTLPEAPEGSEASTIANTPTAEHAPIIVDKKESILDTTNECQTRGTDFTRAFDNTTGVLTLSQQERNSSDAVKTEHTPLNFKSHTSERGKKRKGFNAGPIIGEVQAGTSQGQYFGI